MMTIYFDIPISSYIIVELIILTTNVILVALNMQKMYNNFEIGKRSIIKLAFWIPYFYLCLLKMKELKVVFAIYLQSHIHPWGTNSKYFYCIWCSSWNDSTFRIYWILRHHRECNIILEFWNLLPYGFMAHDIF